MKKEEHILFLTLVLKLLFGSFLIKYALQSDLSSILHSLQYMRMIYLNF